MDATAPTLSLSAVSALAGLRPSYVRGLLDAARIVMLGQPVRLPGHAHRASLIDALRLRALRTLRNAGLSDVQAIYVLDLAIDPLLGGLCLAGVAIPPGMLRGRLHGRSFHVIPDGGGELPDVYSTPSGYPAPCDAPVAITISLSAVLADLLAAVDATQRTAAGTHGRSTGGRAGAAAGAPNPSNLNRAGGTPAMESAQ